MHRSPPAPISVLALALTLLAVACGKSAPPATTSPPGVKGHVIEIDIDDHGLAGLWMANAPNLKGLIARGTLAFSRVVVPTHSNQNNMALLTGQYPDGDNVPANAWLSRAARTSRRRSACRAIAVGDYAVYDKNPLRMRGDSVYDAVHAPAGASAYVGRAAAVRGGRRRRPPHDRRRHVRHAARTITPTRRRRRACSPTRSTTRRRSPTATTRRAAGGGRDASCSSRCATPPARARHDADQPHAGLHVRLGLHRARRRSHQHVRRRRRRARADRRGLRRRPRRAARGARRQGRCSTAPTSSSRSTTARSTRTTRWRSARTGEHATRDGAADGQLGARWSPRRARRSGSTPASYALAQRGRRRADLRARRRRRHARPARRAQADVTHELLALVQCGAITGARHRRAR